MKLGGGSGKARPGGAAPAVADHSAFQSFGISSLTPTATASQKRKATNSGVSGMFRTDDEEDFDQSAAKVPSWSKLTTEQVSAKRKAEALQQEDPTIFQYDEVIDDAKLSAGIEVSSQAVRTEALAQKKRVGLVLPSGRVGVKTGDRREAKYIDKVIVATDRRKVEQQIIEDRLLKKEIDANKDREVFVTPAFKEELARRKKFEKELEVKEMLDNRTAAEGQDHGAGFASFHRTLLDGGLASGRGSEKVVELAKAKEDVKEELKEEPKGELKDELGGEHGVANAVAAGVLAGSSDETAAVITAQLAAQKDVAAAEGVEVRKTKALSAKERYLARKKLGNS